jgi:hypothetical protein
MGPDLLWISINEKEAGPSSGYAILIGSFSLSCLFHRTRVTSTTWMKKRTSAVETFIEKRMLPLTLRSAVYYLSDEPFYK